MGAKKYPVDLTEDERAFLEEVLSSGEQPVRTSLRTRILLKADEGVTDREIVEALDCGDTTPYKVRKRYADRGVDAIYHKQPDRTYERKIDGEAEARLIALACSDPPEGRSRWTVRLLRDEFVELEAVPFDSMAHETVRKALKKTNCNLTERSSG